MAIACEEDLTEMLAVSQYSGLSTAIDSRTCRVPHGQTISQIT